MKVLLTGATGFLGQHLTGYLERAGHAVAPVSRRDGVGYDWSDESLEQGVRDTDAVVHLAGENIFSGRWTAKQKERIWSSRVESTGKLARLVAQKDAGVLVHASAVGFYGPRDASEPLDESAPPGGDFLADVCQAWEASAKPAADAGARVAAIRIGVILGANGGALKKMLLPFKLGLGGPVGTGRQAFAWVHIDDVARLFVHVLENSALSGVFNAVAPNSPDGASVGPALTSASFGKALGRALHRPAVLPLPGFVLRLVAGEVADVLLTGQAAVPARALESGFRFEHPEIDGALRDLLA